MGCSIALVAQTTDRMASLATPWFCLGNAVGLSCGRIAHRKVALCMSFLLMLS